jgi:SAM-dependent methyltransferase
MCRLSEFLSLLHGECRSFFAGGGKKCLSCLIIRFFYFNADSHKIARELLTANGLGPDRIVNATGENIPFADETFDIVYSTNALEHVQNPEKAVFESMRVLKPQGVIQLIYPNYHSLFDGHYAVFHPPILLKSLFPWYVKHIFRRDPAFARTLRTELNVLWTKKVIHNLRQHYNFEVLPLGEKLFYCRISTLDFKCWAGLTKVKNALNILTRLKIDRIIRLSVRSHLKKTYPLRAYEIKP